MRSLPRSLVDHLLGRLLEGASSLVVQLLLFGYCGGSVGLADGGGGLARVSEGAAIVCSVNETLFFLCNLVRSFVLLCLGRRLLSSLLSVDNVQHTVL